MPNGRGNVRQRYVIVDIDSLLRMFGDYLGPDTVPLDSIPVRMTRNPREAGRLGLVIESAHVKPSEAPVLMDFQIKRVFGL